MESPTLRAWARTHKLAATLIFALAAVGAYTIVTDFAAGLIEGL